MISMHSWFLLVLLYTLAKHACPQYMWDSRDRMHHYKTRKWSVWEGLVLRRPRKPIKELLVNSDKILPLHKKAQVDAVQQLSEKGSQMLSWLARSSFIVKQH